MKTVIRYVALALVLCTVPVMAWFLDGPWPSYTSAMMSSGMPEWCANLACSLSAGLVVVAYVKAVMMAWRLDEGAAVGEAEG